MTRRTFRSLGWTGWTAARRFPRPARARSFPFGKMMNISQRMAEGHQAAGTTGSRAGRRRNPTWAKPGKGERERGGDGRACSAPRVATALLELRFVERRFHAGAPQQQKVLQGREWCLLGSRAR